MVIFPEFSIEEVLFATNTLPAQIAPGPDHLPNEVVKAAVHSDPRLFSSVFHKCLAKGVLPARWKVGSLVLIPKSGKPLEDPFSFRPICLLDGCGKLLEKLLVNRIRQSLTERNDVADCQYGFRKGRSTFDALIKLRSYLESAMRGHVRKHQLVCMLTVNVKNAFNSTPWHCIHQAAASKNLPSGLMRMIGAYLSHRSIVVDGSSLRSEMFCSVPQGSVLGLTLWNVFYDGSLGWRYPKE